MNAPLAPAHSPFGGSVAARVLRCPESGYTIARDDVENALRPLATWGLLRDRRAA